MNTDTHYNPGGGGTAYAKRTGEEVIQPGDRIRACHGALYGTVNSVLVNADHPGNTLRVRWDGSRNESGCLESDVKFFARPHAAFNKGEQ